MAVLIVLKAALPCVAAGEFVSAWTSIQTDSTAAIAWGDYDKDGDLDLLAGNYGQASRIYRNDGGGTFTLAWSAPFSAATRDAEWGDYDGDGDLDFVLANYSTQNRVYRNDGGGTFTLAWSTAATDKSYEATWGDYDGDGDLDFAVANDSQPNRIYRNDGADTFTLAWSSTELDYSRAVAWADYDADGDIDLLVGNYGASRIYRNDGSGDFTLAWSAPQLDVTLSAAWTDYDGDGDPDFALGNISDHTNRVYRNDGGGAFTLAWSTPETDSTQSISWGDFDADGDMDLLAGNYQAQPDRIYRNNGGTFSLFWSSDETEETYWTAFGDYDGDGDLDIAAANYAQANRIYQNTLNPANGAPSAPTLTAEPDGGPGWVTLQWTAPADDHTPSALLAYQVRVGTTPGGNEIMSGVFANWPGNAGAATSKKIYLPLGTYYWSVAAVDTSHAMSSWAAEDSFTLAATLFQSVSTSTETDNTAAVARADYDSDGDHDLLVGNDGQANRVYRNDGGILTLAWSSAESDSTLAVAWGDYDRDGDLDFAAGNNGQANRVYRNDGGSFSLAWSSPEADNTAAVAWADADHDGDLDLFAGNNGQANRLYRNDGAGVFTLIWSSPETDNTRSVAWGDYDRDGDQDILCGNYGQANRVYRNDGTGALTLIWSSPQADNTTSVAWGHSDGDGDLDMAVGNDGQTNRLYRNDGGGVFPLIKSFAPLDATTGVRWGDLDGDGDTDLLFTNSGAPDVVYANNGANTYSLFWTSSESDATRAAALFDLDGDGDLDYYAANNGANRVYRNGLNPVNNPPAAPILTAEPDGDPGAFVLKWAASFDDNTSYYLTGYQVRIGTLYGRNDIVSGAFSDYPGNAEATASFYINLGTGVYFWSVRAVDNTGFALSGWSAEDMFLVSGPDTNAPLFDGVQTAAGCGSGCVNLTWQPANDLQNSTPVTYNVYTSILSGGQNFGSPAVSTTATGTQVTGLTNDMTYYFVVRARDTAGNEDTNTTERAAMPSTVPAITKFAGNPVLSGDGTGFDANGVLDPKVYYDGSVFHMWYSGKDIGGSTRMGYAVSKDGVNWARVKGNYANGATMNLNPDANAFDSSAVASGFVMANPPTSTYKYYMWYTGVRKDNPNSWRIGLARSNDGITWERVPGSGEGGSLIGWTTGTFDEYSAYSPWVIYENGLYKMWYTGASVNESAFTYEYRIGYATSADGITWTKHTGAQPEGSILDMGSTGAFDSKRVTHPNVYKENGFYKMIYSGLDGSNYRMGFAAGTDGITWTKYAGPEAGGSIISNGTTYDTAIAGLSSLRIINGNMHLWYEAYTGTADEYHIMYANNAGIAPPKLTAIAITTNQATTIDPGDTVSFTATCRYDAVNPYCGSVSCECTNTVAWQSGTPAAATIGQLTGQATGVALGTTAITASCAGITSNTMTLNVAVYPAVVIIQPADQATLTGSVSVTGTVRDAALDSWTLYYSPGQGSSKIKAIASGTTQVSSGTLALWNTSSLQGLYTLYLVASNTSGYSATDSVVVHINNKKTITGTATAYDWILLSVPVEPDSPAPTTMFASTHQEYKIYKWDPQAAPQPYLSQYVYPQTLSVGQAFWIKSYYQDLPYSYTGALVDTTVDYTMALQTGWNQIGTPFYRDFPLSQVRVSYNGAEYSMDMAMTLGLVGSIIYAYDSAGNSWTMNDTSANLIPGIGYDVYAYAAVSLIFGPGAGLPQGMARRVRPTIDYKIKISASAPSSADRDNYFGTADSAAVEFDALDAQEPPRSPSEKYTSLYFPREQWTRNAGRYAADMRTLARGQGETETWDFVVETSESGQTITLTWDAAALPSDRFTFTLEDMETGARMDMAAQNSYTFTATADAVSETRFRISVVKLASEIVTRTHTLGPGWHLLSVPVDPDITAAFEQLGDDLPLLQVFQYFDGAFYSGQAADIQAGVGYWIFVADNTEIDFTGLSVPDTRTVRVPLKSGWNMIGNPFESSLAWGDNITLACADRVLSKTEAVQQGLLGNGLFRFNGAQYDPLAQDSPLEPWTGYLVKSAGGCDLLLAH